MNNTKTTKEVLNRLKITEEMINHCRADAPNNNCIDCTCTEEDCISLFLMPIKENRE
ncbi:MAG TPA: hypothetical protein GX707_13815 [Epulopiscium sp.]|nr:hypothetical protein [Candidatus Epulonipiscium sp.]